MDVNLILSIPLSVSRSEDVWFLAFESSDCFSVKSAYRHLQEIKSEGILPDTTSFWKNLWRLRVAPKVKDLLWRAATGCLPTKVQLRLRHVDIDVSCSLCNDGRESINHCLVECPFAQDCWARTGIGVGTSVGGTFSAWLEALFERFDGEQRKLIAMTCWALWRMRNDSVWKGKSARASTVLVLAKSSLNQWTKAQDKFEVPKCAFLTSEDGAER